MISLGLGLFGVLWAMTRLATTAFDAELAGYLIGGVVLIGVFVLIERRRGEPMLPLSIFRVPTMAASLLASLFQGLASFAVLFLMIMYLQGPRGLTPIHASLLLVPGYVIGSVVGPSRAGSRTGSGRSSPPRPGWPSRSAAGHLRPARHDAPGCGWSCWRAHQRHRGELLLPREQRGGDEGGAAGDVGIASGMLRTFSNIGMVFSFTVAILIASQSISRGLAFAIFVGTTSLHGAVAAAFTQGLHAAFYAMMGFMVLAASCRRSAAWLLPGLGPRELAAAQLGGRSVGPGHPLPYHLPGDVLGLRLGQLAVAVGGDRGDDGEDAPGQVRAAGRRVVVGRVVQRLHAGQHRVAGRHAVGVELLQRAHGER